MTKSTITREQLEEWVAQFDEDGGCDATDRQLEALIRQSLAALDSEPVAEVVSIYGDPEAFGEREIRPLIGIQQMPYGTKLYRHAQPAPVVPEEKPIPNTLSMYAVDAVAAIAEVKGWNACRAAMLAAAPQSPGSEPATVPGKWIPVSERMPELGDWLVTDGCDFDVQLFNGEQFIPGFVWEDKITHWMPLPAVPQEVKGE
ncbi:Uncharacterised protein [Klebsiella pneumoniae]|nr:DUF551 domain-containing protein [Klebsiella pneumoniae]MCS6662428.1 DUF551 domain-containing protein [Klebsiella pneumoniae subsp. pneumoniae]MDZ1818634.1 DUF551 domain-containing protein [Klebsiella pneumoniae]MEE2439985.1 DUF551 domain-containing protein [Klebsiella pneumoniae]CAA0348284.1 Uncharacterised protein [Klebsiella pneumoniae]HBR3571316.1 DUF551 domain-containing protein [Klebsiella pneumoniae]